MIYLPFCKEVFFNGNNRNYTFKKWVCASELLKNHANIPKEWAECEYGLSKDLTEAEYDSNGFKNIEFFVTESDVRVCFKCLLKWQAFV